MTQEIFIRVIVFKEEGTYIAQCLEYDICAYAKDEETVLKHFVTKFGFERNLSIERNGAPFAGIESAPEEYEQMWVKCVEKSGHQYPGSHITVARCLKAA